MHQPRVFHLLQKAHAALFRAADKEVRHAEGITATQQAILFSLSIQDGTPISAIAEQLKMGKSSLTGLVDRMTEHALVRRQNNPDDGRVQNIFIEPKGRAIIKRSVSTVRQINAQLLSPFSTDEQQTIARFLEHIAANADTIVGQGFSQNRTTE